MKSGFKCGQREQFSIECEYNDANRKDRLSMYVEGSNILAFERDGKKQTTHWDLEELVNWLRDFIDHMYFDPYPVEVAGDYAAQKDRTAREYDTDDMAEFDAYYDRLDDWNMRHRWHPACAGGVLADVYFELVGTNVQISWNNEDLDDDVVFDCLHGGASIPRDVFTGVVDAFLKDYADRRFCL